MEDITVQELKAKMDAKETFVFIDVREPVEYQQYNLGAKLIPLGGLMQHMDKLADHRDSEIVVHCRSGKRSATAKHMMEQQGFSKVRNLVGGVLEWITIYENS